MTSKISALMICLIALSACSYTTQANDPANKLAPWHGKIDNHTYHHNKHND